MQAMASALSSSRAAMARWRLSRRSRSRSPRSGSSAAGVSCATFSSTARFAPIAVRLRTVRSSPAHRAKFAGSHRVKPRQDGLAGLELDGSREHLHHDGLRGVGGVILGELDARQPESARNRGSNASRSPCERRDIHASSSSSDGSRTLRRLYRSATLGWPWQQGEPGWQQAAPSPQQSPAARALASMPPAPSTAASRSAVEILDQFARILVNLVMPPPHTSGDPANCDRDARSAPCRGVPCPGVPCQERDHVEEPAQAHASRAGARRVGAPGPPWAQNHREARELPGPPGPSRRVRGPRRGAEAHIPRPACASLPSRPRARIRKRSSRAPRRPRGAPA